MEQITTGTEMHGWAADLFPICRSLTGPGVRQTLDYLAGLMPGLRTHAVASGTQVFDWTVPDEWSVRDAFIANEAGQRVVDFKAHNLHLMGYSEPMDRVMELSELQPHLYSDPAMPDSIPYVTSYFKRNWGFCLPHSQRQSLAEGRYRVVIDATLAPGVLNYGDLIIPGQDPREILLSTYVCHPSMANNELSGPVLAAALARWLVSAPRRFTYRIVFVPETIGAVAYLSRNLDAMKRNTIAGFVLTCVGDDRAWSFMPSRKGDTLADRVARHALARYVGSYDSYSFLERGSDERQYCWPGVDLPVCSVMRSKYGRYPEYHSSADDLTLITPNGLEKAFAQYRRMLSIIEANRYWRSTSLCEPQLGKRGLYPQVSTKDSYLVAQKMVDVLAYADGHTDLLELAEWVDMDALAVAAILEKTAAAGLVECVDD